MIFIKIFIVCRVSR